MSAVDFKKRETAPDLAAVGSTLCLKQMLMLEKAAEKPWWKFWEKPKVVSVVRLNHNMAVTVWNNRNRTKDRVFVRTFAYIESGEGKPQEGIRVDALPSSWYPSGFGMASEPETWLTTRMSPATLKQDAFMLSACHGFQDTSEWDKASRISLLVVHDGGLTKRIDVNSGAEVAGTLLPCPVSILHCPVHRSVAGDLLKILTKEKTGLNLDKCRVMVTWDGEEGWAASPHPDPLLAFMEPLIAVPDVHKMDPVLRAWENLVVPELGMMVL